MAPFAGPAVAGRARQPLVGLVRGHSLQTIAVRVGRAPSTTSREVAANGRREAYSQFRAHGRTLQVGEDQGPSSVIAIVCSLCAARLPVAVRRVHPSRSVT